MSAETHNPSSQESGLVKKIAASLALVASVATMSGCERDGGTANVAESVAGGQSSTSTAIEAPQSDIIDTNQSEVKTPEAPEEPETPKAEITAAQVNAINQVIPELINELGSLDQVENLERVKAAEWVDRIMYNASGNTDEFWNNGRYGRQIVTSQSPEQAATSFSHGLKLLAAIELAQTDYSQDLGVSEEYLSVTKELMSRGLFENDTAEKQALEYIEACIEGDESEVYSVREILSYEYIANDMGQEPQGSEDDPYHVASLETHRIEFKTDSRRTNLVIDLNTNGFCRKTGVSFNF